MTRVGLRSWRGGCRWHGVRQTRLHRRVLQVVRVVGRGSSVQWTDAQRVVVCVVHRVQAGHGVCRVRTRAGRPGCPRCVRMSTGRGVGVVGRDPGRGVDVVRQAEVHLRVKRVELVEPAVGTHDGGFFVTVDSGHMSGMRAGVTAILLT